ncbi:hypothetical protein [Halobacillus mangrovi]|uniref:hypothetical protein n=1 Tax=Halobacillus mangrovi TaxID=402384 RepID=UPI003D99C4D0
MKNQKKWLIVAAVFLAFAIGAYVTTADQGEKLQYSKESKIQRKAKAVDKENLPLTWREVESEAEIKEFYEGKIRSLKLARDKGLTTTPQVSTPVQRRDGRIQINELWHNGRVVHILYSIDLSTLVSEEKNEYTRPPSLQSLQLDGENQSDFSIESFGRPIKFPEGVIFKNRLYTFAQVPSFTGEGGPEDRNTRFKPFDKELATTFNFHINGQAFQTEPVPLHYIYNPEEHQLGTYTFSETYEEKGLTIQPLELKMGLDKNTLKLKVRDKAGTFNQMIEGAFMMGNGQRISLAPALEKISGKEEVYETEFYTSFEERKPPETITFNLERVHLAGDASYSFDLEVSAKDLTNASRKLVDKKVAEAKDTDIILMHKNQRGSRNSMNVQLNFRAQNHEQEEVLVSSSPAFYSKTPEERPKNVHIKSDNGESDKVMMRGSGDFGYFNVNEDLIKEASKLSITVNNVPHARKINHSFEAIKQ